jgi:hypothetical protein
MQSLLISPVSVACGGPPDTTQAPAEGRRRWPVRDARAGRHQTAALPTAAHPGGGVPPTAPTELDGRCSIVGSESSTLHRQISHIIRIAPVEAISDGSEYQNAIRNDTLKLAQVEAHSFGGLAPEVGMELGKSGGLDVLALFLA